MRGSGLHRLTQGILPKIDRYEHLTFLTLTLSYYSCQ
jgi:hypothetical protein